MAAPDKIYLHEISAEELTENLPYHVCYIRKDALLEWAKKNNKRFSGLLTPPTQSLILEGKLYAYQEFIEKIESL